MFRERQRSIWRVVTLLPPSMLPPLQLPPSKTATTYRTSRRPWLPRISTVSDIRRVSTRSLDVERTWHTAGSTTTWPSRSAHRWLPLPLVPIHRPPARSTRLQAPSLGPTASLAKPSWTTGLASSRLGICMISRIDGEFRTASFKFHKKYNIYEVIFQVTDLHCTVIVY